MTLFALACAIANCLGGRSPFPSGRILLRGVTVGILAGLYAHSPPVGLWVGTANSFWACFGWGNNGFPCLTGRDTRDPTEAPPAFRLATLVTGYSMLAPLPPAQAKRFGGWFMAFRGLYQYPLYLGLAVVNAWAPLIGLGCLLQGVCYRFVGLFRENEASVACAELLFGATYGLLIAACL